MRSVMTTEVENQKGSSMFWFFFQISTRHQNNLSFQPSTCTMYIIMPWKTWTSCTYFDHTLISRSYQLLFSLSRAQRGLKCHQELQLARSLASKKYIKIFIRLKQCRVSAHRVILEQKCEIIFWNFSFKVVMDLFEKNLVFFQIGNDVQFLTI